MTDEPRFQIGSFAAHSARGVVRDQRTRRWTMFVLLVAAMLMIFLGTTLLREPLAPREHPIWFILFWIACGWLTFGALLLAIFDMLLVRAQNRADRKALRTKLNDT